MKIESLGEVLEDLDQFSWKECVYIQDTNSPSVSTQCLIIDDNIAELVSDGFTPFEAEKRGMIEFLSIHDLQGVLRNLAHFEPNPTAEIKSAAAVYYFENDAFMPPRSAL